MRLRATDVARMAWAWAISSVALMLAAAVLPGLHADSPWAYVAAAAVTGVFGVLIRPVLVGVAAAIGWLAVAAIAICGQAVVMHIALEIVPGVEGDSFWTLVAATWIAATVGTVLTWLATSGTDEAFVATLHRSGRRAPVLSDGDVDGVLFVQLDGVPYPIAHWALASGVMPTLRRWIDDGSHRLVEWTVQLPCTTPASQLGILHGTNARVPAFRWYDRELGRMLVANRPADAATIEDRATTGRGLLADDGISISNLFSGDAARTSMTMSRVSLSRGSMETRRLVGRFLVRPDGFARSIARTGAEVARERFQASRQRRLQVRPRVHRSWTFAVLRAATNGVLRDLNTALVAQEMMRGTRSIYVDYVDYDEVAHHAGANRLEALRVLEALDAVLAVLERVASEAPRRYRLVILSDHGQSQGDPFSVRHGRELGDLCRELTRTDVASLEQNVESWGRVGSLLDDLAGEAKGTERAAQRVASRIRDHSASDNAEATAADLVVVGSGNLGLIYARQAERLLLEDIMSRWPRLVAGLVTHPGVGFVAALSGEKGPVALGANGFHRLGDGRIEGVDPLEPFGSHASRVLRRAVEMPEAPDLYVNSAVDEGTLEVAAFEDLVGCHGGLGGWQDRGLLVAPRDLISDDLTIEGAEELHAVLVSMLEQLGHRRHLASPTGLAAESSP